MNIKITYSISENARASADLLYPDGTFIRNLWNHKQLYANRIYTEYINDINELPAGDNYKLRLTTNNIRSYWEGVIGNTAAKLTGPTTFFNMMQAQDMDSGIDSYFYVTDYNENKTSCFRMLKSNRRAAEAIFPTRGMNALHVCVKNGVVYWAGIDQYKVKSYSEEFAERWIDQKMPVSEAAKGYPDFTEERVRKGTLTYCDEDGYFLSYRKPETTKQDYIKWFETYVIRDKWCNTLSAVWATNENDNIEKEFLHGQKYKPYLGMEYKSTIGLYEGDLADITGLAVSDDCIYIAYGGLTKTWYWNSRNVIVVLNLQGKEINKIEVDKPGKMIVVDNYLFYCSGLNICRAKIDAEGNIVTDIVCHVNAGFTVLDVSYYAPTNTIAVAATDGKIYYYNIELILLRKLGNEEMYWDKPEVRNDKFYWEDLRQCYECFICTEQASGIQLIGDGGNQRIQIFDRRSTYIETISWLSTSYQVGVIDSQPNRIFCEYLEFNREYSAQPSWKWRLSMNWGCYAENEWIYLDMPFVLNGKTYARQQSISYNKIRLVELSPEVGIIIVNEVSIPSNFNKNNVLIYPDGCIYRQETKPGYYIRVSRQNLLGINEDGTFNWAAPVVIVNSVTPPPESTENNMSRRVFETIGDTLYQYNAHRVETENHLTAINMTDGTFIANGFPSTHTGYFGDYIDDKFDIGNGVRYPGGIFIAKDNFIICNYHGEFWAAGQVNKWHLFDSNLVALHTYGIDYKTIKKQGMEWPVAMMAGNSFTGNLVKSGDYYYLYHCDEGHHSGIHSVRFEGMDTVKKIEFPVTVYDQSVNSNTVYLLEGLPKYGDLKSGDAGWTMHPEEGYNASSTDHYLVRAGRKFISDIEPSDLQLNFRVPNRTATVSYPLDPVSSDKWQLSGYLSFEDNYHSRDNGAKSGCKLQLLDANDKVLFEIYPTLDYYAKIVTLYINERIVFQLPEFDAEKILDYFKSISVWAKDSILYTRYHTYPDIVLGRIDTKPTQIRLLAYNFTDRTNDQNISVRSLKFNRR